MTGPTEMKKVNLPQMITGFLARIFALICLIMTILWTINTNTDEKFLGGLNWGKKVFNWHPIMMVAGFLFALVNGVLSYRVPGVTKGTNKVLHYSWYIAATVCVCIGLIAVWNSHDIAPNPAYYANLYSLHSIIGISTVVLFGQNFAMGFLAFLAPVLSEQVKKTYKPNHIILGVCTLVLAVLAIETGVMEKNTFMGCSYSVTSQDVNPAANYHKLPDGCTMSNGIGITALVALVLTLYSLYDMPKNWPSEGEEESLLESDCID